MMASLRPSARFSLFAINWPRNRGVVFSISVFVLMLVILQVVKGEGISYFDISSTTMGAGTLALAAVGETLVILAGGFDLSAGSVISLVNVLIVEYLGIGADYASDTSALSGAEFIIVVSALALSVGAAVGAVNSALIAFLGLPAIGRDAGDNVYRPGHRADGDVACRRRGAVGIQHVLYRRSHPQRLSGAGRGSPHGYSAVVFPEKLTLWYCDLRRRK